MRNAPSVSYPVGRSFLRTLLHGVIMALGWMVCGAWAMLAGTDEPARLAVGLACLLVTGVLVWALRHPARGRLRWDGQGWHWLSGNGRATDGEIRGCVRVRLDWQRGMLLEFAPSQQEPLPQAEGLRLRSPWPYGKNLWLWVEQNESPVLWNALRRAAWADAGDSSKVSLS